MSDRVRRLGLFGVPVGALLLLLVLAPTTRAIPPSTVDIQILDISDWHAQLDPLGGVGGAAVLSAYFQAERAANPNTLTFTAGDAYGASPPLSSFFDEEPAVLAMRLMGFDADTLGNHNFDRGLAHLQRMIDLAGAPPGARPGLPFAYVSSNLDNLRANLTGVWPFRLFDVAGVRIGVVGITNPEAPTLVFPGSFGTIVPVDPIRAANKAKAAARRAGAKILIALTHLGVTSFDPGTGAPQGPLIDFAENVGGFDVIFGDHTDVQYAGVHNNALVVENRSRGLTYSRTRLRVQLPGSRVVARSNDFVIPVAAGVTPDPAIEAMLDPYRDALTPILGTVIGSSTVFVPRADACGNAVGRTCESLVGNVTTDAMRSRYGADFAITNSGGLRANLTCPTMDIATDFCPSYLPPPFPISRGQVLTVLPFGNVVVTLQLNGAELKTMLENGVSAMPGVNGRFPQVSGLCFAYDISAPAGSRVTGAVWTDPTTGACTAAPVDLTAASTYTLAENDFMAAGGDGYPVFTSRATTRELMDQVVSDYIAERSPISPAIQGRIVCTTSGAIGCPVVTP
jgi:2',3'-cyclic-nucleotide 2'-phosphodiesterase (5'-nucleotidase family)